MEEELIALLLASAPVAALCATRIHMVERPQGEALPAAVATVIGGGEGHTQDGPDGLAGYRVQIDCYGLSYGSAKALARAIVLALDGVRSGALQGIFHEGSRDIPEPVSNNAERLFRVSSDFMINHRSS